MHFSLQPNLSSKHLWFCQFYLIRCHPSLRLRGIADAVDGCVNYEVLDKLHVVVSCKDEWEMDCCQMWRDDLLDSFCWKGRFSEHNTFYQWSGGAASTIPFLCQLVFITPSCYFTLFSDRDWLGGRIGCHSHLYQQITPWCPSGLFFLIDLINSMEECWKTWLSCNTFKCLCSYWPRLPLWIVLAEVSIR